jgi:predicted PurR-regulated permease PerM
LSPFIDTDVLNAVSQIIQSPAQAITEGLSPGLLNDLLQFAFSSLSFAGLLGLHLFLVLVVSFYLLRDGYKLRRWMYAEFQLKNTLGDQYLRAVDHDFHRIFFGNLLNAIVTGLIGAITFSLVNVAAPAGHQIPYPTLLGLLCGVTSLIPVVGMKLVYVPVTSFLIARMVVAGQLTELLWFPALFVAISFVIVDSIPDFVLRPYISGRDLHIGSLMVAYIVGPLFFGWYGLFLGPMVLVLLFHYARTVFPEVHRQPFTEAIASAQKTLSEFTRKEL